MATESDQSSEHAQRPEGQIPRVRSRPALLEHDTIVLDAPITTIPLGREGGRTLRLFNDPSKLGGKKFITEFIIQQDEPRGIEFVENWDGVLISILTLFPVMASFIVGVTWSLMTSPHDVQGGFGIASYIVTASKCYVKSWYIYLRT